LTDSESLNYDAAKLNKTKAYRAGCAIKLVIAGNRLTMQSPDESAHSEGLCYSKGSKSMTYQDLEKKFDKLKIP